MLIDTKNVELPQIFAADICIIGGGVAGIVLATELLASEHDIILLESGDVEYDQDTQNLYKAESRPKLFPAPVYSRLRFLGGSSNHWENSTERFDAIDFAKRDWVKDSGWPITYNAVAQYYPAAEQYCGVKKLGYDFAFWQNKFHFKDAFDGSELFQSAIAKSALQPTRFFMAYGKKLTDSTKIRIIKNANVVDLDFEEQSETVKSVKFQSLNKSLHQVNAKIFIMCLGGLENPRMLLHFNEKYNNKIGNQFDNVGRYFMEHPTIRAAQFIPFKDNVLGDAYNGITDVSAHLRVRCKLKESAQIKYKTNNLRLFFNKQTKLELSQGIESAHVLSEGMNKSETPENFGGHLMNVLKDADLIAEAYLRKKFQTSYFEDADNFGGYQIVSMLEQTPDRNNRIYLGTETDQLKLKKLKIDWSVSQYDKDKAWQTLTLLAQDPWLQSIGRMRLLDHNEERIWGSQLGFGQHHIGTTKMSDNIEHGVVDSSLKVYGTKNLYISGSSVFPTGGHVPPTLTIVALTLKLADELKKMIEYV